ncbi:MAG: trypsin-like peptidase domain-containing protein, partial [Planctomycetota bacterium]
GVRPHLCPECGKQIRARGVISPPRAIGVGLVCLGVLVTSGGLYLAYTGQSEEAKRLGSRIEEARREIRRVQSEIDTTDQSLKSCDSELQGKRARVAELQEELRRRRDQIAKIETSRLHQLELAAQDTRERLSNAGKVTAGGPPPPTQEPTKPHKARQDRATQNTLLKVQRLVVTVSGGAHKRSGFYYDMGGRIVVITGFARAPSQGNCSLSFPVPDKKPRKVECSVYYWDEKTGLAVLGPPIHEAKRRAVVRFGADGVAVADVGEELYAVGTQVLGTQVLERSVFDGTVTSTGRATEGARFLRTSLPANPGLAGAAVVNSDGALVGVFKAVAGSLVPTSAVIPASEIAGALQRMRAGEMWDRVGGKHPFYNRGALTEEEIAAAGAAHEVPYDMDRSIPWQPRTSTWVPDGMAMPRPAGLVLIDKPAGEAIALYRPGSAKPAWRLLLEGRYVRPELGGETAILSGRRLRDDEYNSPVHEPARILNFRTGKLMGRLADRRFQTYTHIGNYVDLGPAWVLWNGVKTRIYNLKDNLSYTISKDFHVFDRRGDILYYVMPHCLGRMKGRTLLTEAGKVLAMFKKEKALARGISELERAKKEAIRLRRVTYGANFEEGLRRNWISGIPDKLPRSVRALHLIPGGDRVAAFRSVYEVGERSTKLVGHLDTPRHS